MRARLLTGLWLVWMLPVGLASAQDEAPGLDDFGVVPLVDESAPRLVVWFAAAPGIAVQDARAVETQVLRDFGRRRDFRLLSKERVLEAIGKAGKPELARCDGEDGCLLAVGRLVEADRVIGAELQRTAGGLRLVLKAIDLKREPPAKLNSVVEGSVSELLLGGLTSGVAATFDEDVEPVPIAVEGAAPPALATRPAQVPAARPDPGPAVAPAPAAQPGASAGAPPGPTPVRAEKVAVERLEGVAPGAQVDAEAPERPGFFRRHVGSLVSLGVGIAAGGAGLGLGLAARDAQDSVEAQWDPSTDAAGRDQALAANILFGVAGAAAITAVILFLVEPGADDAPSVTPAPGGAAIRF